MLETLILSKDSSYETRVCSQGAMLMDNHVQIVRVDYENLQTVQDLLQSSTSLPVGSVEFVSKCMQLAGKKIPNNISYPKELQKYFLRDIISMNVEEFLAQKYTSIFVKPQKTKLFTGFIFKASAIYEDKDHEFYHEELLRLPSNEMLWVSPVVCIEQEWRCYVQNHKLLGYARYDDKDSADIFNITDIDRMIEDCTFDHPYTIDIGIRENNSFLIECNDAWAIGFYSGSMKPKDYLLYLWARWQTL